MRNLETGCTGEESLSIFWRKKKGLGERKELRELGAWK